ncbi:RNA polymerase sigma-70 factor (ECF subfamily) [Kitasatospora sp. MAP12-15]|uniref:sigma-70 family RNA polymerase sigma factor n=1 Tax=unclassified Kitasatospora TaxID=2633591 RepID=UPI0024732C05|nr:sigma-70 family RNA polymerase sigma factor [Kitasatospora sp. MAP12-44]MDH6115336.1 RNA polymerase sigma-70 factor (ECF subfamily) [Kitasatospora sp. MAP12-44]
MDDERLTALALAAGQGRAEDVEAFVRATQRDVWRFVAHLTDVESADDLTQETFLRALTGLPAFAARSSARTWLLSIARRTVVDRYRSAAVRPRCAALDHWEEAAELQPCSAVGFEDQVVLADLLTFVPAQRREAFVLTQVVGLSYAEAAAVAGCPVGTVRSRVARARDQLVALLHSAESEDGWCPGSGVDAGRGRAARQGEPPPTLAA